MKTLSEASQLRLQLFYNREITTDSEMMRAVYERIGSLLSSLSEHETPYSHRGKSVK
jgi:hypothetical protein